MYLKHVYSPEDIKKLSISQLNLLSEEIREFLISSVSKTGGHLGSSLGCIELTLALHYVFDSPADNIIWDIGHQSYTHKIVTGNKDSFSTLRQHNGLSGFSDPENNPHDLFIGGHSSDSISNASGYKTGLNLLKKDLNNTTVVVIGDASIVSGVAFEAINHLGTTDTKLLIILNDNSRSIGETKGSLHEYLKEIKNFGGNKLEELINQLEKIVKKLPNAIFNNIILNKLEKDLKKLTKNINSTIPVKDKLQNIINDIKLYVKHVDTNIVTKLGLNYKGPYDGHNIPLLIKKLKEVEKNKSTIFHIMTKKGNKHPNLSNVTDYFHGVSPFTYNNTKNKLSTLNSEFSHLLLTHAQNDPYIVAITASMLHGTGLNKMHEKLPKRVFDVGIAEQHAASFSAGLSKAGLNVFLAIYSTFTQRAYDQIIHDICLLNLPIKIILDRGGFVGEDGKTHHGILDFSMFLSIPHIVFFVASFLEDMPYLMNLIVKSTVTTFLKISKKDIPSLEHQKNKYNINISNIIDDSYRLISSNYSKNNNICIISIGDIIHDTLNIYTKKDMPSIYHFIQATNISVSVINSLNKYKHIIFIEESFGGVFASKIIELLHKNNITHHKYYFHNITDFINQGDVKIQLTQSSLDYKTILNTITSIH